MAGNQNINIESLRSTSMYTQKHLSFLPTNPSVHNTERIMNPSRFTYGSLSNPSIGPQRCSVTSWRFLLLFLLSSSVTVVISTATDTTTTSSSSSPANADRSSSRVTFDSFDISPFPCNGTEATSPYEIAEQARASVEDCLRISVPLDCGYESSYIGLGNAVCNDHDNSVTIRGGVMDLATTLNDDPIPSKSDVAQCLQTALLSTACINSIQTYFPNITWIDFVYHSTPPVSAPIVAGATESNDEVSSIVAVDNNAPNERTTTISSVQVLGIVAGGGIAVIVTLLFGFLTVVRMNMVSPTGTTIHSHGKTTCLLNFDQNDDVEGGTPKDTCVAQPFNNLTASRTSSVDDDDNDDAQTTRTTTITDSSNDGSTNSSLEDETEAVVKDDGYVSSSSDSSEDSHDDDGDDDSFPVMATVDATHFSGLVLGKAANELYDESTTCPNTTTDVDHLFRDPPMRMAHQNSTPSLLVGNVVERYHSTNNRRSNSTTSKSWIGFRHSRTGPYVQSSKAFECDNDVTLEDFEPDCDWDPDDNSVSSVDAERFSIAGNGELSFQPTSPGKSIALLDMSPVKEYSSNPFCDGIVHDQL
jgi:hypothetical protein